MVEVRVAASLSWSFVWAMCLAPRATTVLAAVEPCLEPDWVSFSRSPPPSRLVRVGRCFRGTRSAADVEIGSGGNVD